MDSKKTLIFYTLGLLISIWLLNTYVGNPIKDFALQFFTDETKGILLESYEFDDYDDNGNIYYISGYSYSYKINEREYTKNESQNGMLDSNVPYVTKDDPKPIIIEYVYFFPSLSKIKGTGYSSLLSYLIRSLFLKSIFYLGAFIYYIRVVKDDLLRIFSNHSKDKSNSKSYNLKLQVLSFFLDYLLFTIVLGIVFTPLAYYQKGLIIILWFFIAIGSISFLYAFTKRIKDNSMAVTLFAASLIIVGFITQDITNELTEYLGITYPLKFLIITAELTIIKLVFELILLKLGFEVEYTNINWIRKKLNH